MNSPTNAAIPVPTSRLKPAASRPATVVFRPDRPDHRFTLLRLLAVIAVTGALSALADPSLSAGLR